MIKENKAISWMITDSCNHNCSYCFVKKKASKNNNYKEIIKKFSKLEGIWRIIITGGEPFSCVNFKDVIRDIIEKTKHELTIVTNFSPPESEIIEIINIAKKRLKTMTLSLHLEYVKPEDFLNKIQKIKKYLDKYGIYIVVNCVAVKNDLKKRKKIGQYFQKKGIKFILLPDKRCFNNKNYYSNKDKRIIRKFGQTFGLSSINFKDKICSAGKDYFIIDEKANSYRCYSELTFEPQKKSVGDYTNKKFLLSKKIKKCPYMACVCEGPYSMRFIKPNFISSLRQRFSPRRFKYFFINSIDKSLGKFGIFLKKRNPDLYNKLKKIEKKIRK